jgi:hypothetical protein
MHAVVNSSAWARMPSLYLAEIVSPGLALVSLTVVSFMESDA